MEVLVLGGDLRYLEIINNLSSKFNVDLVGYKNIFINDSSKNIELDNIDISKYDVILFPINGVMEKNLINCKFNNNPVKLPNDLLVNTKDNVLIFSGINTPCLDNMLNLANRKCHFLMNDENVIKENSVPTVEGIIADIIINTEKTITDSSVLVFGYGNIGRLLVDYLKKLGADVTVSILLDEDKRVLDNKNINNFFSYDRECLIDSIGHSDIIINTVPKTIINDSDIKYLNRDVYFLDISSHPHGINQEILDDFFIKNKLYLGIPGKVAPKTAGKILTKKINKIMEDI